MESFISAVNLPAFVLERHAILDYHQTCLLKGYIISAKAVLSTNILEKIVLSKGSQCLCWTTCRNVRPRRDCLLIGS